MQIDDNVLHHATVQQALRRGFLGWQCRIRQYAMRQGGGRPGDGMRPALTLAGGEEPITRVVVLMVQADPDETTAQLRHFAKRTHDPAERFANAMRFLSASHYQKADSFADELTALFLADSKLAARLARDAACTLGFEQNSQRFVLPCTVRELPDSHPWWQATYWHNKLFNPELAGDARVLGFQPDWRRGIADPLLPGMG